jgi:hypothetical protein
MERDNQYFKDRTESFDDYYPCVKNECNLFHVHNWIQFFVSMYNDKTFENYFINELNDTDNIFILLEAVKKKLGHFFFSACITIFFYEGDTVSHIK